MSPYVPRMATTPLTNLIVRCYPGASGQIQSFTLYEDDGISQEYNKGASAQTHLTYSRNGNKITIEIGPTIGSFAGQPLERAYVIELPCTQCASLIRVDGKSAKTDYVASERINRISIPTRSIRSGCRIELVAEDADQNILQTRAFARRAGLPEPSKEATFASLVQTAMTNRQDEARKIAILAAAHIGVFEKIENPTGYPNTKAAKTYSPTAGEAH
jgi:hypothetical protein